MKLVQRACVVVTEDMPVDPDARDLQVSQPLLGPMYIARQSCPPSLVT